ncbi:hypothetical protein ACFPQ1_25120, partial [Rhodocytophaga aerolata]
TKSQSKEEPDDGKLSSPVLKTSTGGDSCTEFNCMPFKNMTNKLSLLFLALVFLTGCIFDYSYEKKLIGGYYLDAIDSEESMQLTYKYEDSGVGEGIIGETIFDVGWNDKFIVVKQHPHQFGEPLNKGLTNYYIVRVVHNTINYQTIKNNIIGPLNGEEFNEMKKKLEVPEAFENSLHFDDID